MADNRLISLINNLIMDKLISLGLTKPTIQPPVITPPVTPESSKPLSSDAEDEFLDEAEKIVLYQWKPPVVPSVQIQPFVSTFIDAPKNLSVLGQSIQLSADGNTVVTATITCDNVNGAAEYEFRISSD